MSYSVFVNTYTVIRRSCTAQATWEGFLREHHLGIRVEQLLGWTPYNWVVLRVCWSLCMRTEGRHGRVHILQQTAGHRWSYHRAKKGLYWAVRSVVKIIMIIIKQFFTSDDEQFKKVKDRQRSVIWGQCGPSGAFSLITSLFITQSGHDAYQIKAEDVSC